VTWSTGYAGCGLFKQGPSKKERVEINGASRDVLELTRDEVRKNGARVFWRLRDALAWLDRRGHTRTTLLGNDTTRLSNACPNGISNFAGRVRS
jgi:hypothetical protein